jgi:uncharacterized membrane protein
MKHLTAIFVQGLVAILPLAVTLLILYWLGSIAEETLGDAIRLMLPESMYVPGMGVAAGLLLVFLAGLLVNAWGVPRLIKLGDHIAAKIPLVKTIYGSVRDLLGFFSSTERRMSRVGLLRLGELNARMLCLITRERMDDLPPGLGGEGYITVFVPYSYQIGGLTLIVPREQVEPLEMGLEDAMRFVVTAGAKAGTPVMVAPEQPQEHSAAA